MCAVQGAQQFAIQFVTCPAHTLVADLTDCTLEPKDLARPSIPSTAERRLRCGRPSF